jgi:hypothetical protein
MALAVSTRSGSYSDLPTVAGSGQEGVGDAAADDQLVADLARLLRTSSLVDTLEPATMAAIGLAGAQRLAQCVQFGGQQRAGGGDLGELGYAVGGTFGAVGGAEGVHHEHVAQGGVLLGQLVGVLFLALVEAHVFEQHDVTGLNVDAVQVIGTSGTSRPRALLR